MDQTSSLIPRATLPLPDASPPRRLKRLKKSSQTTTTPPPAGSPPRPPPPPSPSPLPQQPSSEYETLAPHPHPHPHPSPPPNPSPPPPPPPSDADALTPLPASSPNPSSSPLPPTDTAEEEDDGLDPLFSETGGAAGWDSLGAPMEGVESEDEEEMLGGGLIEELRREKSAKKRLDMDEGEGGGEMEVEVKGKRSKRRKEEAPKDKESVRGKKQSEKERRVQLNSIHAESQRLLRETRSASFKPIVQPVYKPISSVLEKIRLRKLEILKMSKTPSEDDDDASSEAVSDPAGHSGMPRAKEMDTDGKDLKIDDADNDVGANGNDLNEHDSVPGDEDALTREKDLNCGSKAPDKVLWIKPHHSSRARLSLSPTPRLLLRLSPTHDLQGVSRAELIDKPLNMGMGNPLIMRQDSTNASMSTEQARRGKFVLRILSMLPLALGTGDTTILVPEVVDDLLQEQGGRHLVPVGLREDDQCIEDAFTTYGRGGIVVSPRRPLLCCRRPNLNSIQN